MLRDHIPRLGRKGMEENREFLARRRAEEEAAAVCAMSDEERALRRELAGYYAQRLAQFTTSETNLKQYNSLDGC
jgi:hypothetical protein